MYPQVESLPRFSYVSGTELRFLHKGKWVRIVLQSAYSDASNAYSATFEGAEDERRVVLAKGNHALVLEPTMDMQTEYAKYAGWIRSNFAFVVDALSGERLPSAPSPNPIDPTPVRPPCLSSDNSLTPRRS